MRLMLSAAIILLLAGCETPAGFERVIGGQGRDRGVFVSPTQDGGYVAVGVTQSSPEGNEDIYLVKTDAKGQLLWSRTYGGSGEDNGWSVHETQAGFAIAGYTKSFGAGGFDFYLITTDPDGETIWSKTYGGEGDDRCWAMALKSDGGFMLAGETTSTGAGEADFFLIETDSSGNELWSRTYGGGNGDRCFAIAQAGDGGYVLAGQTYSEGAGDRDAYIVKTGADGELEWSRTFGGPASDVGHSIIRTSDGHFVVTGYTTSFAPEGDDPYLIKIDVRGETIWTRVLPLEGVNHTLTGDEATDGGFFLVGFSECAETGANAALLVKANRDGHLAWSRDYLHTTTGRSLGYTVQATADGGCVFTGQSTVKSAGDLDLLLVKVGGGRSVIVGRVLRQQMPDTDIVTRVREGGL